MEGLWVPVLGIAIGAAATIIAARLNGKATERTAAVGAAPAERAVAVTEMQAGLLEQRNMLDRAYARIDALEADVAECEIGRDRDRKAFSAELQELRDELRARP
ncbi:hypothetical protein KSP35_12975 [Aquihabitans sp. G128]|uniref:hypothetical protein n=1 Tax=Aquihabitans sp. G128 TaxID=2849779 RepID=UPI001C237CE6|nr:hypothetical protein [Aquihabitans sp. G128]QXC59315.1 hypothetical protein KSP35_12975 [Aquihabitans sp. G128]